MVFEATAGQPWARVPWPAAAGSAVVAVSLQLWGLYRVFPAPTPLWFRHADKVEHAAGFAVPVFLVLLTVWLRAATVGRAHRRRGTVLVAGVFLAHAVLSEIIQHTFYRSRSGDPRDLLADSVGVALGVAGFVLLTRRTPGTGGR
jgi:VanZ family protein